MLATCHFGNVLLASKIKLTPQLIYPFFFFLTGCHAYHGSVLLCFKVLWRGGGGLARNCTASGSMTWHFAQVKVTMKMAKGGLAE